MRLHSLGIKIGNIIFALGRVWGFGDLKISLAKITLNTKSNLTKEYVKIARGYLDRIIRKADFVLISVKDILFGIIIMAVQRQAGMDTHIYIFGSEKNLEKRVDARIITVKVGVLALNGLSLKI